LGLADVAAVSEARVQKILNVIIAALEVWLEGLLNSVSDAIDYVVAKLGEIDWDLGLQNLPTQGT
jgi:hypothetical protein